MQILKTIDNKLTKLKEIEVGAWVHLENPSEEEMELVSQKLNIEVIHLKAALDEEERSRIEVESDYSLIIVDTPILIHSEDSKGKYSTLPFGIILTSKNIITICSRELNLFREFLTGYVREFYTEKKTRFILQLLFKNATYFLNNLRAIDRLSTELEKELEKSMRNKELVQLLELEKSLVYFSTSLRSNEAVLEKLLRLEAIKKYPEDKELLEDVIVENRQAIEMANIYSNILNGVMGAFGSVISNNLNIKMKFLTGITIVLSIPTMISSFFGMNVKVPFATMTGAFSIIGIISFFAAGAVALYMAQRKMF
jgi:magnesium transporter